MNFDRRNFLKIGAGVAGAGVLSLTTSRNAYAANVPGGLSIGSRGANVKNLQNRLNSLGYWTGSADGVYGAQTAQAVMALQKSSGLYRDGVYGKNTAAKLNAGYKPRARVRNSGRHIEVDKNRQIILFVENGNVKLIANTSTGGNYLFNYHGRNIRAVTPSGSYSIYSTYGYGWQTGALGKMWRPAYFNGGIAIHGSDSIPASPVSHGCCRVSVSFMNYAYSSGWIKYSERVYVY